MILKIYYCSFCHKHQDELEEIIAGPNGINICNECVSRCRDIIKENRLKNNKPPKLCKKCGQHCSTNFCGNCGNDLRVGVA